MRHAVFSFALAILNICEAASLFDDDTVLDITLQGPVSEMVSDTANRREHPFSMIVGNVDIDVAVRIRGNSRVVHCRFPPLRLNFSRSATNSTVFAGQDKLKLVTHCRPNDAYEANVFDEYAAYRIMSLLSDISFGTRLLRIRYIDTNNPAAGPVVRHGFVIEPEGALAERHDGEIVNLTAVTRTMLDTDHSALVYIFQFLIGNTDWSLVRALDDEYCCHNGKLLRVGQRYYYVPYDFDLSGLVSARYAKPQPALRLRSVRSRRYRGYCTDPDAVERALQAVVSSRGPIMRIVENLPASSEKEARSRANYLEKFFELAANQDKLLAAFERRCL